VIWARLSLSLLLRLLLPAVQARGTADCGLVHRKKPRLIKVEMRRFGGLPIAERGNSHNRSGAIFLDARKKGNSQGYFVQERRGVRR